MTVKVSNTEDNLLEKWKALGTKVIKKEDYLLEGVYGKNFHYWKYIIIRNITGNIWDNLAETLQTCHWIEKYAYSTLGVRAYAANHQHYDNNLQKTFYLISSIFKEFKRQAWSLEVRSHPE